VPDESPTAADLKAFAGRYEGDEIKAIFQMAPGKDESSRD
jgi:hypothetical protein